MLVMIDNYDSFTWNLVQYFGDLGAEMRVFRNDKIEVDDVMALDPDGIVISPGPSDPDHAGICLDLIARAAETETPLLGVCLGHQAIGQAFGGKVIRAPAPMHGKLSDISHINSSVFSGLPTPYTATRYHSLIVERKTLPQNLAVTAETPDGLIMGLAHRILPIHGIQFHPESIATQHGHDLLKNFVGML
jgi:anthranilate synthase component II